MLVNVIWEQRLLFFVILMLFETASSRPARDGSSETIYIVGDDIGQLGMIIPKERESRPQDGRNGFLEFFSNPTRYIGSRFRSAINGFMGGSPNNGVRQREEVLLYSSPNTKRHNVSPISLHSNIDKKHHAPTKPHHQHPHGQSSHFREPSASASENVEFFTPKPIPLGPNLLSDFHKPDVNTKRVNTENHHGSWTGGVSTHFKMIEKESADNVVMHHHGPHSEPFHNEHHGHNFDPIRTRSPGVSETINFNNFHGNEVVHGERSHRPGVSSTGLRPNSIISSTSSFKPTVRPNTNKLSRPHTHSHNLPDNKEASDTWEQWGSLIGKTTKRPVNYVPPIPVSVPSTSHPFRYSNNTKTADEINFADKQATFRPIRHVSPVIQDSSATPSNVVVDVNSISNIQDVIKKNIVNTGIQPQPSPSVDFGLTAGQVFLPNIRDSLTTPILTIPVGFEVLDMLREGNQKNKQATNERFLPLDKLLEDKEVAELLRRLKLNLKSNSDEFKVKVVEKEKPIKEPTDNTRKVPKEKLYNVSDVIEALKIVTDALQGAAPGEKVYLSKAFGSLIDGNKQRRLDRNVEKSSGDSTYTSYTMPQVTYLDLTPFNGNGDHLKVSSYSVLK